MKKFDKDRFAWLTKIYAVWVVRLEQKEVLDHPDVVDGKN